jgi:serine/threonine protein phosphatase PrpC
MAAAARLIDQANGAGGPDNITVALLRYYEG